jgi:hypothetical protein
VAPLPGLANVKSMGKPSENVDLYGKIHHLKKLGKSTSFLWPFSIAMWLC